MHLLYFSPWELIWEPSFWQAQNFSPTYPTSTLSNSERTVTLLSSSEHTFLGLYLCDFQCIYSPGSYVDVYLQGTEEKNALSRSPNMVPFNAVFLPFYFCCWEGEKIEYMYVCLENNLVISVQNFNACTLWPSTSSKRSYARAWESLQQYLTKHGK